MSEFNPPTWKPGDSLKAEQLNAMASAIKVLQGVRGGPGVNVRRGAGGTLQITGQQPVTSYLCVASGAITARSGTTPGTGTVTLCWLTGGVITSLSQMLTAYNASASTMTSGNGIDSGQYCWVQQDCFGTWWVTPLECS